MRKLGEHAVVLGASMAGLLAARAVSEAYRHVTVIDRDALPEVSADRRGVPQGRHAHALQAGGSRILEEMFPGFLSELAASGVPVLRDLSEHISTSAVTCCASNDTAWRAWSTCPAGHTWSITCVRGCGRCPTSRSSSAVR
ncbi:MAG: hypothetical protein JWQ60_4181 [Pseudonocardia sp.]|nr:hypothetical protein [Pseudonocardia sp.]